MTSQQPAHPRRGALACAGAAAIWVLSLAVFPATTLRAQDHDHAANGAHEAGAHVHPEAASIKNPVKPTAQSLAKGQTLYTSQCASCHGATGLGDGKNAAPLNPKPSNLADASWKHGSSDGEIYTLIKDGSKNTSMRAYASRLSAEDLWNVVNYVRTLSAKP
jgi:mono/diheme cytochrome c family protein